MTYLFLLVFLIFQNVIALTNSEPAVEIEFRGIVFLLNYGLDDQGNLVKSYCNGTVISKMEIATAAHCLSHAALLDKPETVIEFGEYRFRTNPKGELVNIGYFPVLKITDLVPKFQFTNSVTNKLKKKKFQSVILPNEDLAILHLSDALDLNGIGVTPFEVLKENEWNNIKAKLELYLPTVVSVNPFAHITSSDIKRRAILKSLSSENTKPPWITSQSMSRVEPFDSGAPLFLKIGNQWKLLAVTKGNMKSLFTNKDIFSPMFNLQSP